MSSSSPPATTPSSSRTVTLAQALDQSSTLAGLLARLQDSRARLSAITTLIPPGLVQQVRAGPVDDQGWVLLAASGAAAAKLRQLVPLFESRLVDMGWRPIAIKIRIQTA